MTFLEWVQEKWSSEDPSDTIPGYFGKLLVEGGLFVTVSGLLAAGAYAAFSANWIPVTPFGTSPLNVSIGVFSGAILVLFSKSFCRIIREKSSPESGVAGANQLRDESVNAEPVDSDAVEGAEQALEDPESERGEPPETERDREGATDRR